MSRSFRIPVDRAAEAGNGGGPEAVDAALQLLLLARDLELYPDVDVAQELVYDALVERPTPSLRLLGTVNEAKRSRMSANRHSLRAPSPRRTLTRAPVAR